MIYDRFQQEAIDCINQGFSVIVSAPTGAGKTAIAEHVIKNALETGTGVIYTAPIKALSNQKYRDFQDQFSEHIGILTGDVSINADAPVLIMTTEIFRNKILDEPESLKRYSWVIYDEIHYIDNVERGTVWEESIMFLPKHMNLLGLSATIPNIKELAAWVESIHAKPVKIIVEDKRPVPLHFFYQVSNSVTDNLHHARQTRVTKANRLFGIIDYIENRQGLPCIYFVFGRKRTEDLAWELAARDFLNKEEKARITQMYNQLADRFDLKNERSATNMLPLVQKGIAFHHAGMLPTLKEAIERLFTSKLLRVIFTTETFALGINMPSRSVVFDDLMKYYGHYLRALKTRDFYQMAGRAGRRGMDQEGFVYVRVNPRRIHIDQVRHVIYDAPEAVNSQFNTSYATLLNLYQKHQERLLEIYSLSLHYYQSKKQKQKEAQRLLEAKLNLLKDNGFIKDGALTPKGQFAKSVYGYELILSDLYEQGVFEQLDEFGLGVIASAAVFEPRKNQHMIAISKNSRRIRQLCEETFGKVKDLETKYRIYPKSKMPYFHLSLAMEYWLRGTEFSKILPHTDTDEGEVVRYFRMAVQILKEIKDNPISSYILTERIKETVRMINRDVVDAEKQLRES